MRLGRQLLAGLLLAVFGATLACLALEGGVRLLHLVPTRFWEPDPLLGTRLVADRSGWWTQEEHEFRVKSRITSDGRRDVERAREKAAGTFRVLLLGDSFVEALQVPLEDSLGRQLEGRLRRRDSRIEVLSMAVSGYGTAGELLSFRERGRAYGPDLVLVAFYPGNDVRNNSPTLEPVLRPVYDEDGRVLRVAARGRPGPGSGRGLLGRSQAYEYLRKRIVTGHPGLASRLVDLGLVAAGAVRDQHLVNGVPLDYWVYAAERLPEWEEAWRRTFALLSAFRVEARQAGAGFAVAVIAGRDQITPDAWRQVIDAHPAMREIEWQLDGPEQRIAAWCRSEGVPCVLLSPAFRAAAAAGGRPLHFRYDGHFTPAGHALAAEVLANFLAEENLVAREGEETHEVR